jgi:arylsulfate sulfotransferase
MRDQGDDPDAFIRPGVDWLHMNGATYDPRDDSLIVSSRENFLIKIDYTTGDVIWILGDPTKYWYTFSSLRAKALTLEPGGLHPIGQHAPSITSDGLLMVFNDGLASRNQPTGQPAGESRTFSTVSAYEIDQTSFTAHEAWRFDYGQSILSTVCSSAYEARDRSILVNYAVASGSTKARLVALNAAQDVVFDFEFGTTGCTTSWNAQPIEFDDLLVK